MQRASPVQAPSVRALASPRRALADPDAPGWVALLVVLAMGWFAFLAASALATAHPIVLSDEADYLLPTLFGATPENYRQWGIVPVKPSHLYYWLYGLLGADDLHAHAKLLNAACIVAAAIPAYRVARRWLSRRDAAAFAALVIGGAMSTFVRYVMPECLYFLGFWLLIWLVVRLASAPPVATGVLAGLGLALLSLVKPHALGLVLGLGAYVLLRAPYWRDGLAGAIVLAVAYYLARVAAGYALTGALDLSPSGPTYGRLLSATALRPGAVAFNLAGHAAAAFVLAGIPIATLFLALTRGEAARAGPLRDLALLALCVLLPLMAMTVYFSYNVSLLDPMGERITRLHGRYYAFALPLVILAFWALAQGRPTPSLPPPWRRLAGVLLTVGAAAVVFRLYETTAVDFTELWVRGLWPVLLIPVACVAGAGLLQSRAARSAAQARTLPLPVVWYASLVLTSSIALLTAPLLGVGFDRNAVDRAMSSEPVLRALHRRDDGLVAGSSPVAPDLYRVMFYLASRSQGRWLPADATLDPQTIPADVKWLLLLPGTTYAGPGERSMHGPLTLVRLRD